ncbi:hypothetical protein WICPIJ_003271 [Wickerhamomyces pijperi]|uniref:Uncharacterized protein n=1 Tax=Wickerhamomyces pijperi TaxID=599730 RepID=A0A9P8Q9Z4_WICPI|nr:hypothetical protein WICPIJ_003271 [Wickerhamomyces pijperi]
MVIHTHSSISLSSLLALRVNPSAMKSSGSDVQAEYLMCVNSFEFVCGRMERSFLGTMLSSEKFTVLELLELEVSEYDFLLVVELRRRGADSSESESEPYIPSESNESSAFPEYCL